MATSNPMAVEQLESNGKDPIYWLGRDGSETQRLIQQSRFLNPFTGWVLQRAGISKGMKVLDVGSGAGDVALLAADLVGPHGTVVGVDVNLEVLEVARAHASGAGLTNVEFVKGDCRSVALGDGFDAVVGRLILQYTKDPTETLRSLLARLRPGGIVAFQEFNPDSVRTFPPMPLWQQVGDWVNAAARQSGLNLEIGYKLHQHFIEAGLPTPYMQLDSQVGGGPDWEGYGYLAATFRSMLPLVLKSGIATAEEVDIDTLADRLCAATVASGGVVKAQDLVSAWTRKP